MESYPLLNFLVEHGKKLALLLGILILMLGIFAGVVENLWIWPVLGAIGGLLVYGFVASYGELVRLVTDMLLPK